jgi:hypothetical protein
MHLNTAMAAAATPQAKAHEGFKTKQMPLVAATFASFKLRGASPFQKGPCCHGHGSQDDAERSCHEQLYKL